MINNILTLLENKQIVFQDVLSYIEECYSYTPSAFSNGDLQNSAEENQGSARVFYLAYSHRLSEKQTLTLFAEHWDNVLETPEASNHQNIRQFMKTGWPGIKFNNCVLRPKPD